MRDRRRRWEVIGPGTVVIGPGTGQWQWRGLFEDLLAYQGDAWAGDVIDSWAQQHPGVIAELHAIGAPGNHRARVTWRRGEYSAPPDMPVRSPPAQSGGLARSAVMGVALAGDSLAGTPRQSGLRCPRRGTLPQGSSGPRLEGGAMPEEQAADGASDRGLRAVSR
jgi:hypothetical protein